jgi:hypothetical protein
MRNFKGAPCLRRAFKRNGSTPNDQEFLFAGFAFELPFMFMLLCVLLLPPLMLPFMFEPPLMFEFMLVDAPFVFVVLIVTLALLIVTFALAALAFVVLAFPFALPLALSAGEQAVHTLATARRVRSAKVLRIEFLLYPFGVSCWGAARAAGRKRKSVFATAQVNGFRLLSFPPVKREKRFRGEDITQRACFSDARRTNCRAVLPFPHGNRGAQSKSSG